MEEKEGEIKVQESNYELQWKKSIMYIKALPVYFHRLPDIYFNSVDNVNPKYNPVISSALFGIILFFLSHFDRQKAKGSFIFLI